MFGVHRRTVTRAVREVRPLLPETIQAIGSLVSDRAAVR
jgi:hypothetical protein